MLVYGKYLLNSYSRFRSEMSVVTYEEKLKEVEALEEKGNNGRFGRKDGRSRKAQ